MKAPSFYRLACGKKGNASQAKTEAWLIMGRQVTAGYTEVQGDLNYSFKF